MNNGNDKIKIYSIGSFMIAIMLLLLLLGTTCTGKNDGYLPGIPFADSHFTELGTDLLTPIESMVYPSTYVVQDEKPYIIKVDYSDFILISEFDAELSAQQFINEVFEEEKAQQLSIDRRTTELSGTLPKWTISFKNNTISEGISIEAMVSVNAISGGIIGYRGEPILNQGKAENQLMAEMNVISILQLLEYKIPNQSRFYTSNKSDAFGMTYQFMFQQVINNVMIDTGIGTLKVSIDASSGGLRSLSFNWISIEDIPTEGVISSDVVGDYSTLSLIKVSETDFNTLGSQEFRLCWVKYDISSGEYTLLDAFNGDLVDIRESYDKSYQNNVGWIFTIPIVFSLIPATASGVWIRKVLHRSFS